MKKNLELKLKINSIAIIEKMILNLNIGYNSEFFQEDIYYHFNKGLLKVRIEGNEKFLIFYLRDEKKKDRWSNYSILKLTEEKYRKFLDKSYNEVIRVKKTRKLFIYKNTRIHLDRVDKLGEFLELETVVNQDDVSAKMEFDEVVTHLNLDLSKQINDSYKNMLMRTYDCQ